MPLINGDVLRLPVRDGAVDAAVAWFSLHDLSRSLVGHALAEITAVLRKDGVFAMVTHAGEGDEKVEHDWHGNTEYVSITCYDSDELRSTLGTHGIRTTDVRSRPPLKYEHAVTKLFVTATAG